MKIGTVELENNLFLAPMAGVTDLPFRCVCRKFGAGAAVSEMVSSKAIYYKDKKTELLLQTNEQDSPLGVQLFGSVPEIMAYAAKVIEEKNICRFLDINMGCPMPKITGSGDGSALMRNPDLIFRIVQAVKNAVSLPVTVKLRAGYKADAVNAVECAKAAEAGGASMIAVHGKTREQMYMPPVNLAVIRDVKQAISVPVIGNGDIRDGEDAARMQRETGCDGLMIGRAALGNPFIFEEIGAYLKGVEYHTPGTEERMRVALRHLEHLVRYKGEHIGMLEARKHLAWYLKGVRGAAKLRAKINEMKTWEQAAEIAAAAVKEG